MPQSGRNRGCAIKTITYLHSLRRGLLPCVPLHSLRGRMPFAHTENRSGVKAIRFGLVYVGRSGNCARAFTLFGTFYAPKTARVTPLAANFCQVSTQIRWHVSQSAITGLLLRAAFPADRNLSGTCATLARRQRRRIVAKLRVQASACTSARSRHRFHVEGRGSPPNRHQD